MSFLVCLTLEKSTNAGQRPGRLGWPVVCYAVFSPPPPNKPCNVFTIFVHAFISGLRHICTRLRIQACLISYIRISRGADEWTIHRLLVTCWLLSSLLAEGSIVII